MQLSPVGYFLVYCLPDHIYMYWNQRDCKKLLLTTNEFIPSYDKCALTTFIYHGIFNINLARYLAQYSS